MEISHPPELLEHIPLWHYPVSTHIDLLDAVDNFFKPIIIYIVKIVGWSIFSDSNAASDLLSSRCRLRYVSSPSEG